MGSSYAALKQVNKNLNISNNEIIMYCLLVIKSFS